MTLALFLNCRSFGARCVGQSLALRVLIVGWRKRLWKQEEFALAWCLQSS